ncbi:MAG: hypothetical protein RL120_18380 [Gammaproteobacteria bacterium]
MRQVFTIKSVPRTSWSSATALSIRPAMLTLVLLCAGLVLFGVGEAMLIASGGGVSPWTVLAQGISLQTQFSIGWATFWVSVVVLLSWIPLRQIPGLGTILNVIIISATLELALLFLPQPEIIGLVVLQIVLGILLVGLGSGIYLVANLGAGPRDGLMTGLQRVTGMPIAAVRAGLEISVVVCGWLLGGVVGLGTVLFALGIGPAVSLGLFTVQQLSGKAP